jgi:hypothetical protein
MKFEGKWGYNLNYWTGGTQEGSKGNWRWCSKSGPKTFPNDLIWAPDQPDNKLLADDCLHMKLSPNKTGIQLWDQNCSSKFVIACEVFCFILSLLIYGKLSRGV